MIRYALSFWLVAAFALAQPSMRTTTLVLEVDASQTTINVASVSGITPPGTFGATRTYLYVDKELMEVQSLLGTAVRVLRGVGGTAVAAHNAAATVYVGPASQFANDVPSGACSAASWPVTPRITPSAGKRFQCTSGSWADMDGGGGGGGGGAYSAGIGIVFAEAINGVTPIQIDTADVPRLGSTNIYTGTNDFSAANVILPSNQTTQGAGYYMLPFPHAAFSNGQDAFTTNTAAPYYTQFILPTGMTLRRLRVQVTAAGTGSTPGTSFAIYDAACNRVAQFTAQVVASTGVTTFTLATPVVLPAGVYHLGQATQATGQTYFQLAATGPNIGFGLMNEASFPRNFTGSNAATGTGTGLVLPATCGTRTASNFSPITAAIMP